MTTVLSRCSTTRYGPSYTASNGPYRVVEHRDRTVVIDIPGRGHDTVTLDRVKPSIIDADHPPVLPTAHPRGRPPRHPRPPPPAGVAPPPEIQLQATTDPSTATASSSA